MIDVRFAFTCETPEELARAVHALREVQIDTEIEQAMLEGFAGATEPRTRHPRRHLAAVVTEEAAS